MPIPVAIKSATFPRENQEKARFPVTRRKPPCQTAFATPRRPGSPRRGPPQLVFSYARRLPDPRSAPSLPSIGPRIAASRSFSSSGTIPRTKNRFCRDVVPAIN